MNRSVVLTTPFSAVATGIISHPAVLSVTNIKNPTCAGGADLKTDVLIKTMNPKERAIMKSVYRSMLSSVLLLASTWPALADIVVSPNTNATQLANAITAGGAAGINVTAANLSGHSAFVDLILYPGGVPVDTNVLATSSGLYILTGPLPDTYNLTTNGIILSTGRVEDYGTGTNYQDARTTGYLADATPEENALLATISGISNHYDVTSLDLVFNVQPGTSNVSFQVVWGTEEYDEFIGTEFVDAFGIFLNGSNIAFAANAPKAPGVAPISVDHTNMAAVAGTELDGVLAPNGNPVLKFTAPVVSGSASNTLKFIIADSGDDAYDATVYIAGFGGSAEAPPICSLTPPVDTNAIGQTHTVIATVITNGVPVAGLNVSFSVNGAHTIAATNVVTAGNGQASFSYTGTNVGEDTILAAGGLGQSEFSCDATKVWIAVGVQPEITCPANIITNTAAGICERAVTFNVPAAGTPTPTVVCSPASGFLFPKGVTTVNCTASNSAGTALCSFTVTVNDTEFPTANCQPNIISNVPAGVTSAIVDYVVPPNFDNCPTLSIGTDRASHTTFLLGTSTIHVTTVDTSGNSNQCAFLVIVQQTSSCTPVCPADIITNTAPGVCGATVTFSTGIVGECPGIAVTPPSGSFFNKGTTPVTITSNSIPVCTFNVTVNDTQKPTITCPGTITTNLPAGVTNAVVNYTVTVSDNCAVASTNFSFVSGSTFFVGATPVTCIAADTSGNTSTCTFNVVVNELPPETHDLALIKLKAPKNINLEGAEPSLTKFVKVTLQNRSPHNETITDLTGLVTLVAESLSNVCPNATVALHDGPPNNPKTLKPKQKLTVTFDVTYNCANDPAKGTGHEDFRFVATVNHAAIDGNADTHTADDDCPRAPLPGGTDLNPDPNKPLKDKGCGNKDRITKQVGADVLTDVFIKQ